MPYFDLPLDKLKTYWPDGTEQDDFDAFWDRTLTESRTRPLQSEFKAVDYGMRLVETYDVTFAGYRGQPIKGWLILPSRREGKIPCVVEYVGYTRGRGLPIEHLVWANAGYAHLLMDTRGQGSSQYMGATADEPVSPHAHIPGYMTRGILDEDKYYYRRVYTDAVRAIEAARSYAAIDSDRIVVTGRSQGGGISLAAAALVQDNVQAVMPDVPFLCHFQRAIEITEEQPYIEITKYLSIYRESVEKVWKTLSYFDGINFAPRITIPAYFSVGLMDEICPPSTVFAAYNRIGSASKSIEIYPYNQHEGGGSTHQQSQLEFLQHLWG